MRVRVLFGLGLVVAFGAIVGACKAKGNGVGSAPPDEFCPATITEGTPCFEFPILCPVCSGTCGTANVCGGGDDAGVDAGPLSKDPPFNMYCPGGPGATWACVQPGDGGTLDADAGEVDGDASSEADAGETDGDATDGESESDVESDADVAADGVADTIDEADAAVDTAPEVDLDADADGD